MMMIAFITIKSSLVPLIEGLCAQTNCSVFMYLGCLLLTRSSSRVGTAKDDSAKLRARERASFSLFSIPDINCQELHSPFLSSIMCAT